MFGTYDKKNLNIIILKILWEHTDEDHSLQQQEVVSLVKSEYGLEIDRRTVKNNMEMLRNMFCDSAIEISMDKGYRLVGREFTDAELRMLIDSVLFSKLISQKQAKDLIGKLRGLSSKYFSAKVSHVYNLPNLPHADKKKQVLYNLDVIHDAISVGKKIRFIYNKYNPKFELVPKREDYTYVVNPYHMVAKNGFYYLVCNFEKYDNLTHLRIDKMTNVEVLEEKVKEAKFIPELKQGFQMPKHLAEHIYMYPGASVPTTIRCKEDLMDELIDWFGRDFKVLQHVGEEITVKVMCNEQAMFYWALQYGDCAEILAPASLREKIKEAVENMAEKYQNEE